VTVYSVTGPDGQVHQFDADSQENAQKAFDWERMNTPAPTGSMMRIPLRAGDGSTQIYEAPSVAEAQKAMTWDQRQAQERISGSTAPVSRAPGDWMGGATDWLKGGPFTATVRGGTGLVDLPERAGDFPRTMISPPLAERYRAAMATPPPDFLGEPVGGGSPGQKLGDAIFRKTGIPEYQAETPFGRTAMATVEGGISGAPFGVGGAIQGAIGGAAGQSVRELAPEWPRLAAIAGVVPSAGTSAYRYFNPEKPPLPPASDLKAIGGAGLDQVRQSPVMMDRGPLQQAALDELSKLSVVGRTKVGDSNTIIENAINQKGDLSFHDLMDLREQFRQVLNDHRATATDKGNPYEVDVAQAMLKRINQHIDNLPMNPGHVTAGTPEEVAATVNTYRKANANYGAGERSLDITGSDRPSGTGGSIMGRTENRTRKTNYSDALDTQIRTYMENDKNTFGWSANDLAALEAAKTGGRVRQAVNAAGSELGGLRGLIYGGGGAGALASMGGGWPALLAAGVPNIAGRVARNIDNALARRDINNVARQVREGSPEYQDRLANMEPNQAAVVRALIPGLLAPPPQPGSVVPASEVPDPQTGLLPPLPGSRTPRLPPGPSPDGRLYSWSDFGRLLGF